MLRTAKSEMILAPVFFVCTRGRGREGGRDGKEGRVSLDAFERTHEAEGGTGEEGEGGGTTSVPSLRSIPRKDFSGVGILNCIRVMLGA